jgi:hypothetical protein
MQSPVTNYCFTWYSVVINLMFNTLKPLSIFSERTAKKNMDVGKFQIIWEELYGNYDYRADFSFEL